MKIHPYRAVRRYLPILLSALLTIGLSAEEAQEEEAPLLVIRVLPDVEAIILATLPMDEVSILPADAAPLEPALYQQGWRAVSFALDRELYVKAIHIGKDFAVALEAPVYLYPEENLENLITLIEPDDRVEVIELEKAWGLVRLKKPMRGFAWRAEWAVQEEEAPPPPLVGLLDQSERIELEDVREEPRLRRVTGDPNLDEGFDATMRTYEGFLRRTRRFLGRGPTEPYALYDLRGRRIAVLNTDRLLLTTSIERLVGRPVKVHGILRMGPTGEYSVIDVESLRVR